MGVVDLIASSYSEYDDVMRSISHFYMRLINCVRSVRPQSADTDKSTRS